MPNDGRFAAVVLTLFVWGLAGALFGGLFAGLYQMLVVLGVSGWWLPLLAATAAAMTTATFYSAMPVALAGAMGGVLGSIGYLVAAGHRIELTAILFVATLSGFVAGVFYAWTVRGNPRPLTGPLTGALAGLGAGGVLVLALRIFEGPVGTFVLAAGVVALVGALFEVTERRIDRVAGLFPVVVGAPLVAGLIASVVGAGIWLMSGTTLGALDPGTHDAIQRLVTEIPPGALGGMLGGAVTGVLLEFMGYRLEDRLRRGGLD